MFSSMNRIKKQLPIEEVERILNEGTFGTLALTTPDGYPYALPLSYVYHDGSIYLHGAKKGLKIACIENQTKASFSVVGRTKVLPEKFSTLYESVVAFGTIQTVTDETHQLGLEKLIAKYASEYYSEGMAYIQRSGEHTAVLKLTIEHVTGKGNWHL